jgi:outer membrane murein-binding lipoprotein Lpp
METDEKDSLELKKLALEIADLERPWWKRSNYILAALPTLVAVIALSVGFINGYFSAQLTKLENQKHDLETQVKDFEAKRDELHRENDRAKTQLDVAKEELADVKQYGRNLRDEMEYFKAMLEKCESYERRDFRE